MSRRRERIYGKGKGKKYIKTTIYLEEELWKALKWEAIDKKTTLSDLINKKLKEYERFKRTGFISGS